MRLLTRLANDLKKDGIRFNRSLGEIVGALLEPFMALKPAERLALLGKAKAKTSGRKVICS